MSRQGHNARQAAVTSLLLKGNYLLSADGKGVVKVRRIVASSFSFCSVHFIHSIHSIQFNSIRSISVLFIPTLQIWHHETYDLIDTIVAHKLWIYTIKAVGDHVFTCSRDKTIKVWS